MPSQDPTRADGELDDLVVDVFARVLEAPPDQRPAALAAATDDPRIQDAVRALLHDHDQPAPALQAMLRQQPAALAPPTTAPIGTGTKIAGFAIENLLGRGGMGFVYRARQDRPQREVALKVLSPAANDKELVQRFEREVEILGQLQHPGICRIYGAGTVDLGTGLGETSWFAMELVDGVPLTEFARVQALSIAARCDLLAQVADAVQHAHERGFVHRDLKPANILVARDHAGAPTAKVLDFGIAHAMTRGVAAAATYTRTGALLGTLDYMSPEQLAGRSGGIDARSDVYALGVILYELLAGRVPLALAEQPLAIACRLVEDRTPVSLGRLDRSLRGDLATIVDKALAKEPADRYRSAAEFAADLRRWLRHEPILATRATAFGQFRRFARKNRAVVLGAAATMLTLLVGLIGMAILAARNQATGERLRQSLYRSQMRLGTEAMLAAGGIGRVREIVQPWLPTPGTDDLRGFEWHLLWASCHRELTVVPAVPAPTALVWQPHGRQWLLCHHRGVLGLDSDTGARRREWPRIVSPVAISVVSADGRTLVQSLHARELQAIDLVTGARGARFDHVDEVHGAAVAADGSLLATEGPSFGVRLWNLHTGEPLAALAGPCTGAMAFSPDGRWFAAANHPDGSCVRVWAVGEWAEPRLRIPGNDTFLRLQFDPASSRLAACGFEGRAWIWNVADGAVQRTVQHDDGLRDLAFAPDGGRLAVACRNYIAYVHDLRTGAVRDFAGHAGVVGAVAWSSDGSRLWTASDDGTVRTWDPAAPPTVRELPTLRREQPMAFGQLAWADDRHLVVIGDGDRPVVWDTDAGERVIAPEATMPLLQRLARFDRHRFFAAAPDRRFAVAGGRSDSLWLLDADDHVVAERVLEGDVRGLCWLSGSRLCVIDSHDAVTILDGRSGEPLLRRPVAECTLAIGSAPDGNALAIGCVDQAVRVWSPPEPGMLALRGHTAHVQAVAFAPDGKRLASGARDRTVRIWDVAGQAEVASLTCQDQVTALAWSPDSLRLCALLAHGGITLWDARRGR